MSVLTITASCAFSLLLGCALGAQGRTVWAPAGSDVEEGNTNNRIPFWSQSATYQQIHDFADMARLGAGQAMTIRALSFRPEFGAGATSGHTLDLQLVVANTTASARSPSTTFAQNLGPNPTTVHAWGTINVPPLVSGPTRPNPAGFTVPFQAPFLWSNAPGNNLVWEWRHRNLTGGGTISLDAATAGNAIYLSPLGRGCTASGGTQPARITSQLKMDTGESTNVLANAAPSAPAAMFVGFVPQTITLPGLCSSLELLPVVGVGGTTDPGGGWTLRYAMGDLRGMARATLYTSFVFIDVGLPAQLGMSDASRVMLPLPGAADIARVWAGLRGSGNGNETATVGYLSTYNGLVTGFVLP